MNSRRYQQVRTATEILTALLLLPMFWWLSWWGLPLALVPGFLINWWATAALNDKG